MKIKFLILICLTFIMCGCTAEVNLEVTEDKINESTDITVYANAIYTKEVLTTSFRNYIPIYADDLIPDPLPDLPSSDIEYYEKTTTDLGNGYLFNYKYNFDIDEYEEARTVKNGFKTYSIDLNRESNTLSISTGNDQIIYFNDYPMLEEIKVNIKTDYLVEENNADSIDGNTYTWTFTKDSNKSINMLINMNSYATDSSNTTNDNYIIIGTIVVVVLIILLFLIFKNNKNNKI